MIDKKIYKTQEKIKIGAWKIKELLSKMMYFSIQEIDDVFVSENFRKKWWKQKERRASWDRVSLCLYLALLAIFASPLTYIKLYGYELTISYLQKSVL